MKYCTRKECKQINPQPLHCFSKNKSKKDGLSVKCRSCAAEVMSIWHKIIQNGK